MIKKCGYCGKILPPDSRDDRQYCNVTCRVYAWRVRKREKIWDITKPEKNKIFYQR